MANSSINLAFNISANATAATAALKTFADQLKSLSTSNVSVDTSALTGAITGTNQLATSRDNLLKSSQALASQENILTQIYGSANPSATAKYNSSLGSLLATYKTLDSQASSIVVTHKGMASTLDDTGNKFVAFRLKASMLGDTMSSLAEKMQMTGYNSQWMSRQLETTVTAPVLALTKSLVGLGTQLEESQRSMSTTFADQGLSVQQIDTNVKSLTTSAQQLSTTFGNLSDTEILAISEQFTKLTSSIPQIQQLTQLTAQLTSIGGFANSTDAGNAVATLFNAMNGNTAQTTLAVQQLTAMANANNTTVNNLVTSIGTALPLFKEFNIQIPQGTALLESLNKQGLTDTSTNIQTLARFLNQAGAAFAPLENGATSAKTKLTGFASWVKAFNDSHKNDQLQFYSADGQANISQIMKSWGAAYSAMNTQERTYFLSQVGGKTRSAQDVPILQAMLQAGDPNGSFQASLNASQNAASKWANSIAQFLGDPVNKVQAAMNSLKNAGQNLGTQLLPGVVKGAQELSKFVTWVIALPKPVKELAAAMVVFLAAIGPIENVIGDIKSLGGAVIGGMAAPIKALAGVSEGAEVTKDGSVLGNLFGTLRGGTPGGTVKTVADMAQEQNTAAVEAQTLATKTLTDAMLGKSVGGVEPAAAGEGKSILDNLREKGLAPEIGSTDEAASNLLKDSKLSSNLMSSMNSGELDMILLGANNDTLARLTETMSNQLAARKVGAIASSEETAATRSAARKVAQGTGMNRWGDTRFDSTLANASDEEIAAMAQASAEKRATATTTPQQLNGYRLAANNALTRHRSQLQSNATRSERILNNSRNKAENAVQARIDHVTSTLDSSSQAYNSNFENIISDLEGLNPTQRTGNSIKGFRTVTETEALKAHRRSMVASDLANNKEINPENYTTAKVVEHYKNNVGKVAGEIANGSQAASGVKGLFQKIMGGFGKAAPKVAEDAAKAGNVAKDVGEVGKVAGTVGEVAGGAGEAGAVLTTATESGGLLGSLMGSSGIVGAAAALGPVLPILAAIGAAIAVVAVNWKAISKGFGSGVAALKSAFSGLLSAVVTPFKQFMSDITNNGKGIGDVWSGIGKIFDVVSSALAPIVKFLGDIAGAFLSNILKSLAGLINIVQGIVDLFSGNGTAALQKFGNAAKDSLESILIPITDIGKLLVTALIDPLQLSLNIISGLLSKMSGIPLIGGAFKTVSKDMKDFSHSLDGIKTSADNALTSVGHLGQKSTITPHFSITQAQLIAETAGKTVGKAFNKSKNDTIAQDTGSNSAQAQAAATDAQNYINALKSNLTTIQGDYVSTAEKAFSEYRTKIKQAHDDEVTSQTKAIDTQIKNLQNLQKQLTKTTALQSEMNTIQQDQLTIQNDLQSAAATQANDNYLGDTGKANIDQIATVQKIAKEQDKLAKDTTKVKNDQLNQQYQDQIDSLNNQKQLLSQQKTLWDQTFSDETTAQTNQLDQQLKNITKYNARTKESLSNMQGQIISVLQQYAPGIDQAGAVQFHEDWNTALTMTKNDISDQNYWAGLANGPGGIIASAAKLGDEAAQAFLTGGASASAPSSAINSSGGAGNAPYGPPTPTPPASLNPANPMASHARAHGATFHTGGPVGGGAPADVPATLQTGEYVVQRQAVNALGLGTLDALNNAHIRPVFHSGGFVDPSAQFGTVLNNQFTNLVGGFMAGTADIGGVSYSDVSNMMSGGKSAGATSSPLSNLLGAAVTGSVSTVLNAALSQLGVPYLWGGEIPGKGFDCSGLVQWAFKQAGISLPRTTFQQVLDGVGVDNISNADPGDLLFYPGSDGTAASPGHVGIYLGGNKMIDAPYTGTTVRIDGAGAPTEIRRIIANATAGLANIPAGSPQGGLLGALFGGGASGAQNGSLGGGISIGAVGAINSTQDWANAFLNAAGLPDNKPNVAALMGWEAAEGGNWHNNARFNPLDTTQIEPGSTPMNSVGVQAYTSWQEGLQATLTTLTNGRYGAVIAALKNGSSPDAVAAAVAASPWGTPNFSADIPNWFHNGGLVQLATGGNILSDGLAYLHQGESVLTKPLTQQQLQGNHRGDVNIYVTIQGTPTTQNIDELSTQLVNRVIPKIRRAQGYDPTRRISNI